jgi:hypothetical protein
MGTTPIWEQPQSPDRKIISLITVTKTGFKVSRKIKLHLMQPQLKFWSSKRPLKEVYNISII